MALKIVSALTLVLLGTALAHRPENVTMCDYYTPLITGKENSPASQQQLMLTITHTFILGNYTTPNVGVAVAGIAAPGKFQGHDVNELAYFVGGYASTNEGGPHGVVKNFLDDGGAVPLTMNKPANGTHSNQYNLLTHVYQYFGTFYGCSHQGGPDFPSYQGRASMYEVHKYMDIEKYEMDFFTLQIVSAVASLGFEAADVHFTNASLHAAFGHRCSPPTTVIPPAAGQQLQSICVAPDCPLHPHARCGAYPDGGPVEQPAIANATLVGDVVKANETEAAPTAVWPAHCKRDGKGSDGGCASASGSASASAASGSHSGNAAAGLVSAPSGVVAVLASLAWAAVMVGGGAVMVF